MRKLPLVIAALLAATCTSPVPNPPEPMRTVAQRRGAELYARHCAVCHGADGDADTVVAGLLLPRPTPFRMGLFKLVSTTNGMPTEDDLVATLRRGMPGSTMMGWGWLPEDDLRTLAREVRLLAIQGRADSIHQTAAIAGRPIPMAQATELAERELLPGPTVDAGEPAAITPGNLAEGERLYRQHCASCHGDDGRGLPEQQQWQTDGTWLWPRDFTAGYLRGDAGHRDLAFRIRAGMPGAHMPPTRLATAETEALVNYVRSMIPETARDHHVQWRRTIRIAKVAALPPADAAGELTGVDTVRLPLAPLWWRPEAPSEVALRAAHDGKDLVLQLEWADATRTDRPGPEAGIGDGAAVQFARSIDPPLFAMGSSAQPVNVWRWHAFDPAAMAGITDLAMHQGLDVPVGDPRPRPVEESIEMAGIRSAGQRAGSGLPLRGTTEWRDGRWLATFRRALVARTGREVDLTFAGPLVFAVAIWDGAIDRHAGSKAITTWHVLELEH